MRNALSAYAYAGSPETTPAGCTGTTYSQSGGDPSVPCHFDMTNNYSPMILTNAINQIRGALLGCVFDVPVPTDGSMVDPDQVNVDIHHRRNDLSHLYKRSTSHQYVHQRRLLGLQRGRADRRSSARRAATCSRAATCRCRSWSAATPSSCSRRVAIGPRARYHSRAWLLLLAPGRSSPRSRSRARRCAGRSSAAIGSRGTSRRGTARAPTSTCARGMRASCGRAGAPICTADTARRSSISMRPCFISWLRCFDYWARGRWRDPSWRWFFSARSAASASSGWCARRRGGSTRRRSRRRCFSPIPIGFVIYIFEAI